MSELSPYKAVGLEGFRMMGRAKRLPEPKGFSFVGVVRWNHRFRSNNNRMVCQKCRQAKFLVDGTVCRGKP